MTIEYDNKLIELTKKLSNMLTQNEIDVAFNFLNEKITHLVITDFFTYNIIKFNSMSMLEKYGSNKIKLVSLYIDGDGTLKWKLSKYLSESTDVDKIYPCVSEEDAKNMLRHLIKEKLLSLDVPTDQMMIANQKYDLGAISNDMLQKYWNKRIDNKKTILKIEEDRVKKLKEEIESLKKEHNLQ